MKKLNLLYFITFLSAASSNAFAASRSADKLGQMISNLTYQLTTIDGLLRIVFWLMGLGIGASGLIKMKELSEGSNKVSMKDPLLRLVVAGFIIALPSLISIIIESTVGMGGETNIIMDSL